MDNFCGGCAYSETQKKSRCAAFVEKPHECWGHTTSEVAQEREKQMRKHLRERAEKQQEAWQVDKRFLQQHRAKGKELERLGELIQRIEARITAPATAKITDMPKGKGSTRDPVGRDVAKLNALKCMYNELWDELIDDRLTIQTAAEILCDPKERILVQSRYLEGKSWEDVAGDVGCSIAHARGKLNTQVTSKINTTCCG